MLFIEDATSLAIGSGSLATFDQMVDPEQDKRTDKRHEETGRLSRLVMANGAANPGSEKGTRDTNEHGDKDSARLFAGNDELRKCPNN